MGVSEAQKKATIKWQKEKVEGITFRVPTGNKARIQEFAKSKGESTNAFIYRAINETMLREGGPGPVTKDNE